MHTYHHQIIKKQAASSRCQGLNQTQQSQGTIPLPGQGSEEEEEEEREEEEEEGGMETEAQRREEILSLFSWGDSAGGKGNTRREGNKEFYFNWSTSDCLSHHRLHQLLNPPPPARTIKHFWCSELTHLQVCLCFPQDVPSSGHCEQTHRTSVSRHRFVQQVDWSFQRRPDGLGQQLLRGTN